MLTITGGDEEEAEAFEQEYPAISDSNVEATESDMPTIESTEEK